MKNLTISNNYFNKFKSQSKQMWQYSTKFWRISANFDSYREEEHFYRKGYEAVEEMIEKLKK